MTMGSPRDRGMWRGDRIIILSLLVALSVVPPAVEAQSTAISPTSVRTGESPATTEGHLRNETQANTTDSLTDRIESPVNVTDAPFNTTVAQVNTNDTSVNTPDVTVNTTDALVNTTEAPINATDGSVNTTDVPMNTTEAPVNTTHAPVNITELPVNTTDTTANTTDAAVNSTGATVNVTDVPVNTPDAPVNTTDAPVNTTDASVNTTDAPVNTTDAPVNTTDTPVNTSDAPVNTTDTPVNTTDAPVNTTDAPVNTTDMPANMTSVPASTIDVPVNTTEVPANTTEASVSTTDALVSTTDAPLTTADMPAVTTEAPACTTEAPVITTVAPVITTDASVTTTPSSDVASPEKVLYLLKTSIKITAVYEEEKKEDYKLYFQKLLTNAYGHVLWFEEVSDIDVKEGSIVVNSTIHVDAYRIDRSQNATIIGKKIRNDIIDIVLPFLNSTNIFDGKLDEGYFRDELRNSVNDLENGIRKPSCDNTSAIVFCARGHTCYAAGTHLSCRSLCADFHCQNGGTCSLDSKTWRPVCVCAEDDRYVYQGETCEIGVEKFQLSREQMILIAACVGGGVLLIVIILVIVLVCQLRNARNKLDDSDPTDNNFDHDGSIEGEVQLKQFHQLPKSEMYEINTERGYIPAYNNNGFTEDKTDSDNVAATYTSETTNEDPEYQYVNESTLTENLKNLQPMGKCYIDRPHLSAPI